MSTLNVANISDGTDTVETGYVVNGSAKAWVNLACLGTISVQDSLNVSGAVDLAVGAYKISFASSMANALFAPTSSTWQSVSSAGAGRNVYSPTINTQSINTIENDVSTDPNQMAMSISGDLA